MRTVAHNHSAPLESITTSPSSIITCHLPLCPHPLPALALIQLICVASINHHIVYSYISLSSLIKMSSSLPPACAHKVCGGEIQHHPCSPTPPQPLLIDVTQAPASKQGAIRQPAIQWGIRPRHTQCSMCGIRSLNPDAQNR